MQKELLGLRFIWRSAIIILIVAMFAGIIYLIQQVTLLKNQKNLSLQVQSGNIEEKSQVLNNSDIILNVLRTLSLNQNEYKKPLIIYTPNIATDEEKNKIEKMVINPYMDYHDDNFPPINGQKEQVVVAFLIDVPKNDGESYGISVILHGDSKVYLSAGEEGFIYGKRNQEYYYWRPDCMGDCLFSESFKLKYPEIVNNQ
jgi:hypothetical protein